VGAGHGHWTRTIARLVHPRADLVGLEREPAWVEEARKIASVEGRALSFVQGTAEALPFPDAHFDVVTCQTVLIHMKDPRHVVREMLRVLKPGGRLLLLEPNIVWSRTETLRSFTAGGGRSQDFEELWLRARRVWEKRIEDIESGRLGANEGGLFYVLCATRA
jgi:ubiquinone/menaquinone biosynthesis C-methylase UbiE